MKPLVIYLAASLLFISCIDNPFKKPARKIEIAQKIVGSWNLLVLKVEDSNGHFHYPFNEEIQGFAVFDRNNNFSLQYYDATRPRMRSNDPFFCADPEIRIAFLSASSFFGKYKLLRDSVDMNIMGSLNPNLKGIREKRLYKIQGDTMLLIAQGRKMNGVYFREHSIWLRSGR